MPQSTVGSDLFVNGTLSATAFLPPTASINDPAVIGNAQINASKLQQRHMKVYNQPGQSTVITDRQTIHLAQAAGTIQAFKTGITTACAGAATITVDLWKNGVSVLTAVLTISNTTTAYTVLLSGSFSSTSTVAGDVWEVNVVATAGGGTLGKGVFAEMIVHENSQ